MERFRKDIRGKLTEARKFSINKREGGDFYPVNRSDFRYLNLLPQFKKEINKYIRELRESGEKFVYVDVCGNVRGYSIGADKGYSFSNRKPWFGEGETQKFFEGDIFKSTDFINFLNLMKEGGDRPNLVTFEPIVGLQEQGGIDRDLMHEVLLKNLERMIKILKPGGYIFLSKAFQMDVNETVDWFNKVSLRERRNYKYLYEFCRKRGCTLKVEADIGGSHYLIKKIKYKNRI